MRATKSGAMGGAEAAVKKDSAQFAAICRELLHKGFSVRFTAQGESMRPNILPGDRVLVAPIGAGEVKRGQVVLAQSRESLRVHRMVARLAEGGAAITRGDAGRGDDEPTREVLGRVTATEREGREISFEQPWMPLLHAVRTFVRKARLAGRRKFNGRFLAVVPVFILLQLFAGAEPVKANKVAVTITQTPSVSTISPGGQVTYTDVLMNTDGTASTHIPIITQPIPTNTTFVSFVAPAGWSCTAGPVGGTTNVVCTDSSTFPASGTATMSVTVQVTAGTPGQTVLNVNNTPTVTPNAGFTVTPNITNTVTVISADLSLTQSAAPATVSPSGTITYTNSITNVTGGTGGSTAAAPQLTFATPAFTTFTSASGTGYACSGLTAGATGTETCTAAGPLAAGGTSTITIVVTVNAGVALGTTITGTANVSSTTFDPNTANNMASSTSIVSSADLALTQTAAPAQVGAGATLSFTNVVANNGPSTAATPQLTFAIPTHTTYQSFTSTGYNCTGVAVGGTGTLTCTATGNAANGSNATITISVLVTAGTAAGTVISGSAAVTSTTFDPNSANNTATSTSTVAAAELSLGISTSSATVALNGTISYTIVTTNNGPATAANPQVVLTTPANTTFQSATPPSGATCGGVAAGATGTLTCNFSSAFSSGTSGTIVVAVTVNTGVAPGTVITGTATASSTTADSNPANNSASASVTVAKDDLAMTQAASPAVVASGSTITYTEVVTNNGPAPAPNAVLYQQTPPNTVFASITAPAGWTCNTPAVGGTGQVTCLDGTDLPVSTPAAFTYVVTVNAGTAADTTLVNSADVSSSAPDSNPSNNATTTTVLVETAGDADIFVAISAVPTPVFVSSTLTYTIQVSDLGLVDATGVSLSDPLPAGTTLIAAVPSQGTPCTGTTTITCALGTIPNGATATVTITVTSPTTASTLTNTASATTTATDPVSTNNSATAITVVQPLVCAKPGNDGAGGTVNTIVNAYYPPAANGVVAAGATTVTLGAAAAGGATTPIASGDLLLFIQMQDAAINFSNSGAYGDGMAGDPGTGFTALNNAGNFEYVTATSAVPNTGGALTFTGTGPNGGLLNTYTQAAYIAGTQGQRSFQVIRVPQYTSATLASGLKALAWNGATGGVVVLDVASQLTLGGPVVLDGLGFRGGGGRELGGGAGAATDYVTLSSVATNGSKGEGIAGTPEFLVNNAFTALITGTVEGYPNGSYARGAPGNAGGGATDAHPSANDQNSGGGGGGNGGAGGQGGFGWSSAGVVGGFGGSVFPASTSALELGGGAGAGTTNNGTADPTNTNPAGINSSGAAGGGILIIHAGSVTGTGTISANGQTALNVQNDGGGGGGAAGSIRVLANSGGLGGLTVAANGGAGGNTWTLQDPTTTFPGNRHGPGGGGGGGIVELSATPASASVAGGINGGTTTALDAYGATPGAAGSKFTNITIAQTPGVQSGAYCAGADVAVTNAGTPNPVTPLSNITYTQVVTNSGPLDALNAVFSEAVPANTTFQSITAPAGWTCNSNASILATGNITCTNPDLQKGAAGTGTFTVVTNVNAAATFGSQIVDTANVTSGTTDNNLANNSATVAIVVGSATSSFVTLTKTPSAPTVVAGNNITYTMVMTNNGPAAATPGGLFDTVPTNTTFVSISAAGWSCSAPPVGGTGNIACTAPSLANGATATFTLVVNVNATGVANGTVISNTANANAGTPNPNPTAASATANVTVAGATQSDLSITSTVAPNPILSSGTNPTFTQVVTNNGPAAVATATYVDTLPSNATFVSLVPPSGWTCGPPVTVGAVTTITCTGPLTVGGTATFPLVMKALSSDTPGTLITNTATIGPTANDPNTANNTASSSTVVASPSQADVSIVKTGTPEPVNLNTNLNYTLQVTNNGPAVATGVTVSDPLPSAVVFSNVTTTQGTCTQASGTVSCSLGTMNVGTVVVISINVNAATLSSSGNTVCNTVNGIPFSVCNTATVSSATSDPNLGNNSSTANSTIQSSTAVQLSSFRAQVRQQGGVLLEWHTQEEIRNLGFNVYREDPAGRQRVNPSIIAGAALLVRGGQPQHGAKTYYWIDPKGTTESSYVLEDVDLNGTRSTHGPVNADVQGTIPDAFAQVRAPERTASPKANIVSRSVGEVANAPLLTELNQLAGLSPALPVRALVAPRPRLPVITPTQHQVSLDSMPALKIAVQSEGWYYISRAQLIAAGFNPGWEPQTLQLFAEGVEQPLLVAGDPGNRPNLIDGLQFYGTGIDTPFSDTRIYWLVRGTRPGKRVTQVRATGSGASTAQDFLTTVVHEDHTTYFATLLNGENQDNFFGDAVTTEPVDEALMVAHFNTGSALPTTVDVTLQGATDQQAHSVSVSFNGNPIGQMDFFNQSNVTNTFPINSSLVQNGGNTVTLTALDGDNDVSLVQSVALHYPHTYAADGNWLRASVPSGAALNITGFTNSEIRAYDITDPEAIIQLDGVVQAQGNTFSLALTIPSAGVAERTLLVFSADQMSAPSSLTFHEPDTAIHRQQRSDIVVISHPDFVASLAPFVALRQQQGRQVSVVTTDQLYDAFNFGERTPFAIRSYLQQLSSDPTQAPQAVLFVGDASLDPRNYLGLGDFDFVPTRIIETQAFKTASDDWFTDFDQTGFATIPTGRIPVRNPSDAALVISKIVNYESGATAGSWNQQALLIADQNVDVNFSNEAAFAASEIPANLQTTSILADSLDVNTARGQILNALNSGALLVNYTGHGATEQWSFSDLLDNNSAATLTNGDHLPFYLLMDCLNGFFHDVYTQSLAESLLLAPNGGAVAVWASSGFTAAPEQGTMDQALLRILKNDPGTPLGEGILGAKLGITDPDIRRTWIFFGDPSMQLQSAPGAPSRTLRRPSRAPTSRIKNGLATAKEGN
jgi:uncharacterized repeat protein (TIGR01451 family)